jgi:hypothetical protein
MPFWGSSNTPLPKGGAALRKIEAHDADGFAVAQLKGIKLTAWATVLAAVQRVFLQLVYAHTASRWLPAGLGVPELHAALVAHAAGQAPSRLLCWLAVLANFINKLLAFTIWSHLIIAGARLAGFQALRSTYRPLSSTSLADWWNRVYYYFKELLAEFFFFPAYFTFFKKRPTLRMLFATFAAAGFGNFLYHWLADVGFTIEHGLWRSLWLFRVYALYCLILGVSIAISQVRQKRRPPGQVPRWTPLGAFVTLGFYALIGVLDGPDRALSVSDYGRFFLSLLGG